MAILHITQDDDGYWMLSAEEESGTLVRIASHHASRGHLIHDALEMAESGEYQGAAVIIEAPQAVLESTPQGAESAPPVEYRRPAPRRARL